MRGAAVSVLLALAGTGLSFGGTIPAIGATPALQEECTGCHAAMRADTPSFQELTFPHLPHVSLEGGCLRCHGEHVSTGTKAGIKVAKGDCRSCHHESARRGSAVCERCHSAIFASSSTFQGRPFNHSSTFVLGLGTLRLLSIRGSAAPVKSSLYPG